MELVLSKQARKYLEKADEPTRRKLWKALDRIAQLDGNIERLEGHKNRYRYKMDHYRITFDREKGSLVIAVIEINTRTNIKYR